MFFRVIEGITFIISLFSSAFILFAFIEISFNIVGIEPMVQSHVIAEFFRELSYNVSTTEKILGLVMFYLLGYSFHENNFGVFKNGIPEKELDFSF